jgi:hypothetical protein
VPAGQHVDALWAGTIHLTRLQILPREAFIDLAPPAVAPPGADVARDGEMANLHTRLSGIAHVNVQGLQALPHLQEIVSQHGPMLAEYGPHGGSVARVENGEVLSQEEGKPAPTRENGALGYVVVPLEEATARGLTVLQYPRRTSGYIGTLSPEEVRISQRMEPIVSSMFNFRAPNGQIWLVGINSALSFVDRLLGMPRGVVEHHMHGGDFSSWVENGLGRPALAARIRNLEAKLRAGLNGWEEVREEVVSAFYDDYREPEAAS